MHAAHELPLAAGRLPPILPAAREMGPAAAAADAAAVQVVGTSPGPTGELHPAPVGTLPAAAAEGNATLWLDLDSMLLPEQPAPSFGLWDVPAWQDQAAPAVTTADFASQVATFACFGETH